MNMAPDPYLRVVIALAWTAASVGFGGCVPVESEVAHLTTETMAPAAPREVEQEQEEEEEEEVSCTTAPTDPRRAQSTSNDICLPTQTCKEGACADQLVDCYAADSCADPTCTQPGRYSVDEQIVADLDQGRRLWQRHFESHLNYVEAEAYCANLNLANIKGWHLPDGAESGSIVYRAGGLQGCGPPEYCVPAIDQAAFPDTEADLYWTSQPYEEGMHFARSYCDGRSTPYKEDDSAFHFVRCVHDPLP